MVYCILSWCSASFRGVVLLCCVELCYCVEISFCVELCCVFLLLCYVAVVYCMQLRFTSNAVVLRFWSQLCWCVQLRCVAVQLFCNQCIISLCCCLRLCCVVVYHIVSYTHTVVLVQAVVLRCAMSATMSWFLEHRDLFLAPAASRGLR